MIKYILLISILNFGPYPRAKNNGDVFCYACAKCSKVVYFETDAKNYYPPGYGCKVSTFHDWCMIGISGNIVSACKYCKVTVRTSYQALDCTYKATCRVSKKNHSFYELR